MKPRFAARVRVRVALQSACLIAVAVGIFGMNALGNCGMPDMLGMSSMTPTSINQSAGWLGVVNSRPYRRLCAGEARSRGP